MTRAIGLFVVVFACGCATALGDGDDPDGEPRDGSIELDAHPLYDGHGMFPSDDAAPPPHDASVIDCAVVPFDTAVPATDTTIATPVDTAPAIDTTPAVDTTPAIDTTPPPPPSCVTVGCGAGTYCCAGSGTCCPDGNYSCCPTSCFFVGCPGGTTCCEKSSAFGKCVPSGCGSCCA